MNIRTKSAIAVGAVSLLALSGCASAETATVSNGDNVDMSLAVFNGWDEGIAVSELWKAILDEKGYNVELEYAAEAPVYSGLSTGDYDLSMDIWLPVTHAEYLETYGDDIADLGEARLRAIVRRANAVGALTTTKAGAIPALPTKDELEAFLMGR